MIDSYPRVSRSNQQLNIVYWSVFLLVAPCYIPLYTLPWEGVRDVAGCELLVKRKGTEVNACCWKEVSTRGESYKNSELIELKI